MRFKNATLSMVAGFAVGALMAQPVQAQDRGDEDWCRDWSDRDRGWSCEIRETTLSADRDVLEVDGRANGGIRVEAWDRNEVLVRAKVYAQARSDADAEEIVGEIAVQTGRVIRADGPRTGRDESWGVSYQIFVPRESNLDLETMNGGISVEGVDGRVSFSATNGGVKLYDLAGEIRGRTTNGGLEIELTGAQWDGSGMDVRTTNGGVRITVPDDYSAHLETGTVNGRMRVDFPVMVQGRIGRELSIDLGSGGRTVRAVTTNGGVVLRRG